MRQVDAEKDVLGSIECPGGPRGAQCWTVGSNGGLKMCECTRVTVNPVVTRVSALEQLTAGNGNRTKGLSQVADIKTWQATRVSLGTAKNSSSEQENEY